MKTRNQVIDIIKAVCSVLVVFLHFKIPGGLGSAIFCVARCAVPTFFVVSGYFYYKDDKNAQMKSTKKKFLHIIKILLIAEVLAFVQKWIPAIYASTDNLNIVSFLIKAINEHREAWLWISLTPLFNYTAWFLSQLALAYLCFYIFTRFNMLKKVKYIIASIFVFGFIFVRLPSFCSFKLPPYTDYFFLFMGLPFFSLGYYFREYTKTNSDFTSKTLNRDIVWMIIAGVILILLEACFITSVSLYFGSVVIVLSFIVLWEKNSNYNPKNKIMKAVSFMGANLTLYIYILHSFIGAFPLRNIYYKVATLFINIPIVVFNYIYPIFVLGVTTVISYVIYTIFKKMKLTK